MAVIFKTINIMKVDFNKSFKDYLGVDTSLRIKDTVCQALYTCGEGLSAEEKLKAYKMSVQLIALDGIIDVPVEDFALIKKVCEKSLTAGAYGQIVDLIEEGEEQK